MVLVARYGIERGREEGVVLVKGWPWSSLLCVWWISAIYSAACHFGCSWGSYLAQTGPLKGIYFCLETLAR
jgi:hypothetical protein